MVSILQQFLTDKDNNQLLYPTGDLGLDVKDNGILIRLHNDNNGLFEKIKSYNLFDIIEVNQKTLFDEAIEVVKLSNQPFDFKCISYKNNNLCKAIRVLPTTNKDTFTIFIRDLSFVVKDDTLDTTTNYLLECVTDNSEDEIQIIDRDYNLLIINNKIKDVILRDGNLTLKKGDNLIDVMNAFGVADEMIIWINKCFQGERINFKRSYLSNYHKKAFDIEKTITKIYDLNPIKVDDEIKFVIITTKDITVYENTVTEARKKQSELQAIIDSATDGIVILDTNLYLKAYNKVFNEYYQSIYGRILQPGLTFEQSLLNFDLFTEKERTYINQLAEKSKNGAEERFEVSYLIENNTEYFQLIFSPIKQDDEIIGVSLRLQNITDRKLSQIKLIESEQRYQFAMDAMGEGLWDWDIINDESFHSIGWLKIMGLDPDNYQYDRNEFSKHIHPDDYEYAWENINNVIEGRSNVFQAEHRMITASGKVIWVADKGKVVEYTEDGRAKRMVGAVRDITQKVAAREELETSRAYLEATINSTHASIWLMDMDNNVLLSNESFKKGLNGINLNNQNQVDNQTFQFENQYYYQEFLPHIEIAKKGTATKFEISHQTNKRTHFYEVSITPVFLNNKNQLLGLSFFCVDITDRKNYENEIISQKQFIEQVINLVPNLIFVKDLSSRFVLVNKAVAKVYGTSIDSIIGKSDIEINNQPDEVENFNVIDSKVFNEQITILVPEEKVTNPVTGEVKWFQTVKVPMISSHGDKQLLGVSTDISERKVTEEEKAKLIEELILKNKNMEQFTYIISHNLRSPVAKIIGLTDLFERDKDASDVNKYIIDSLSSEAYHLDNIIKDLNAIINLKTNLDEVKEFINFQDTLNPIKELLEKEISAVDLVLHEDFSLCPSAYAIKSYMHSILLNLLTNAIKYRSTDRTLEIHVESKIIGEFVMLSFTDNGLGIDLEKYRDTIFGLFKRFHHHIEGKGMGLHITKTQVEMMGGKMDVESEVNVGTTFIIYLPQVDL